MFLFQALQKQIGSLGMNFRYAARRVMRGRECCVKNCGNSSHDPRGRELRDGPAFHCFPAWRTEEGGFVSELTRRRRAAWVAAVGRSDITFGRVPSSVRVCSRHFHSGKPASEMLDLDPDWVPSLHLGHDGEGHSRKKRRRAADDCGLGLRRAAPPPWTEVRSALQVLLQEKPVSQELRGQTSSRPAGTRKDTGFRDFFRNALESSLEASTQSRTLSRNQSSSTKYEVELSFRLPPLDGEPSTCKESTSCKNCSQLLRRIRKLERWLFQLASKQDKDGLEASLVQTNQDRDQDHQSSEKEKETCERTQDVFPGTEGVSPGTEDVSPGTEDFFPGTKDVFPGTEDVFPETEDVFPETEDVFPETEDVFPGTEDVFPVTEDVFPVTEDVFPVTEDVFPVTEDVFPVTEDVFPVTEDVFPGTEDVFPGTGCLSPVEVDDSYMVLYSEMAPLSPDSSSQGSDPFSSDWAPSFTASPPPARPRPRPRPRFRTEWLDTFPFLRYSSAKDVMWCHVCRVYSDSVQQNHSLIRGSKSFLKANLRRHSSSFYHQQNEKRHLARSTSGSDV